MDETQETNADNVETEATEAAQHTVETTVAKPATRASGSDSTMQSFKQLTDAINGLPEAVANAVKEVIPAAPKQPARRQQTTQTDTKAVEQEPKKTQESKPGKKTFAEMWFG